MKHAIEVSSREEGRQLEAGLQDPTTRATVRMVGMLSALSPTEQERVMEALGQRHVDTVRPHLDEEPSDGDGEEPPGADPLKPDAQLLTKLGSIAVHVDEALSPLGHSFDVDALRPLLEDDQVQEWLVQMDDLALVPKKRSHRRP